MELDLRVEQRTEEAEALEMVEVQMREQQVHGARLLVGEVQPERAQSRTRVQDDEVARLGPELDARCVPTGSNGIGARCR
jgi:hypothetical protein